MKQRIDPEGRRLPIKLDSTSNGEFAPVPLAPANLAANRLAHEFASFFSKKTNLTRRSFLVSSCGAASTLLAFNAANAAAGRSGGFFDLPKDAALDEQLTVAAHGRRRRHRGRPRVGDRRIQRDCTFLLLAARHEKHRHDPPQPRSSHA